MTKFIIIISLIFFYNISFSQNYEFKEVYLRDSNGKFTLVEKQGKVIILANTIELFDQVLFLKSKRFIFDEKGIKTGMLYSCTDNVNWYSILITTDNTLYFKNKELEMFRIKIEEKCHIKN